MEGRFSKVWNQKVRKQAIKKDSEKRSSITVKKDKF